MRSRRTKLGLAVAAAIAAGALATACASGGGPASQRPDVEPAVSPDSTAMVRVINQRPTPMQVSLVGAGQSRFLGTVASEDTVRADIPGSMLSTTREIHLATSPLGGGASRISQGVFVRRAPVIIQWTLTPTGPPEPMVLSGQTG